jgi:hypothetical protein
MTNTPMLTDLLSDNGRVQHGARVQIIASLAALERWIEHHQYMAYEPFDGLSSPFRILTCGTLLGDRLLLQIVRQSPINLRPLLRIKPLPSTKGRGYMAAGYLSLLRATGDETYKHKAVACLEWLMAHKSPKFAEYSWANHFDFASRGGRYTKDESIIVWTALIGHAFVDGFEVTGDARFLDVANSACRWILALPKERTPNGDCLSYLALGQSSIHNSNMLGAGFLARCWTHSKIQEYIDVASSAMLYSCTRQLENGAWWYGEDPIYHWIDGFHTGYNLDSLRWYADSSKDGSFRDNMLAGLAFYKHNFFEGDGCPRYYHNRTQPIDSQCAAQAIETLARFSDIDGESLPLAERVAVWTTRNMQARDGHIYYRAYPVMKAKAPMFHWAQATTYRALAQFVATVAGE